MQTDMNSSGQQDQIGLWITTLIGQTEYSKGRPTKIYLIYSTYCGQTYVEHINDWDRQYLPDLDLVEKILSELNCESTPEDFLMNCFRFGHKIKFDGNVYSVNRDLKMFRSTNEDN